MLNAIECIFTMMFCVIYLLNPYAFCTADLAAFLCDDTIYSRNGANVNTILT